jgi:23S rRNA (uracil1939-C5)-methyltransferase
MAQELLGKYCKIDPIIGMEEPFHYRNKVTRTFGYVNRRAVCGIYQEGTHRIVQADTCLIEDPRAMAIAATIRKMLPSFKIRTYDEDTEMGFLRHVLIRCGRGGAVGDVPGSRDGSPEPGLSAVAAKDGLSQFGPAQESPARSGGMGGDVLVVLVAASPIFPTQKHFVRELKEKHPEITGIVLNVNDKHTTMVLGEREKVLYGKGYVEDELEGYVFRIGARSFYQVNKAQAGALYRKAVEMAHFDGNETLVDAYCGIGAIGIIAAKHVRHVIGVELNPDAVRDAVANAKRNGITNIRFYENDAGVFLQGMAQDLGVASHYGADTADTTSADDEWGAAVPGRKMRNAGRGGRHGDEGDGGAVPIGSVSPLAILLDPPRSGATPEFLSAAVQMKPTKIIYISCDLHTLARDLEVLGRSAYRPQRIALVDMFPWTGHVEAVAVLTKSAQGSVTDRGPKGQRGQRKQKEQHRIASGGDVR